MTRRESREAAMALVFEQGFDVTRTPDEIMQTAVDGRGDEKPSKFAESLFRAVSENMGDIDEKIAASADKWRIDRIGKVTLAILRVAAAELYYFPEIPVEITVNEALEIARRFDDERSVPFINGVLGRMTKGVEKPDAKAKPDQKEDE